MLLPDDPEDAARHTDRLSRQLSMAPHSGHRRAKSPSMRMFPQTTTGTVPDLRRLGRSGFDALSRPACLATEF